MPVRRQSRAIQLTPEAAAAKAELDQMLAEVAAAATSRIARRERRLQELAPLDETPAVVSEIDALLTERILERQQLEREDAERRALETKVRKAGEKWDAKPLDWRRARAQKARTVLPDDKRTDRDIYLGELRLRLLLADALPINRKEAS
ncbi:hypothetical protein [Curtobacterium flaccumfaciens]|uniref:hypothetical protein n=1 Tax=Curtobacterium flaccumfaciens TaxID=2035 RepID=UPI003992F4FB